MVKVTGLRGLLRAASSSWSGGPLVWTDGGYATEPRETGARVPSHHRGYVDCCIPGVPVFIDTRFELHPQDQWQDYLAARCARHDWETTLDRCGVDTLLLDGESQITLIETVRAASEWQQCYVDDHTVAVTRKAGL